MKLSSLYPILESVEFMYYDPENFDDSDLDPYEVAHKAEVVAMEAGIRIMSNKELKFVALDHSYSDPVVGGVWAATYHDDDNDAEVYDFDVAVDKDFRGPERVGLKLIDLALSDYQDLPADRKYVRVWVINPKLVRVLERKYGFEIESQNGDGSAHMTYH